MDTETGNADRLAVVEWMVRVVGTSLMTGAVIAGIMAALGVFGGVPWLLVTAPWVGIAVIGAMLRTS